MARTLKRTLLAFWAVWLTVVFATNVADAAKVLGLLPESWAFASGNFRFVSQTTARYGLAEWMNGVLFAGVILWEGLAAVLFWQAAATFTRRANYTAFLVSLLLWTAFLVTDEIFIAYAVAGTHLRIFTAQLVTLLAIELLPDDLSEN